MHGIGVWESADGRRRYQGGWHANAPHGLGRMAFAHGDVYEGCVPSGALWGTGGATQGRFSWEGEAHSSQVPGTRLAC